MRNKEHLSSVKSPECTWWSNKKKKERNIWIISLPVVTIDTVLSSIWTVAHLNDLWSVQVPLYVATKMASIRKSSFFVPSADTYARAAIRHIGYEPRCTPYWPHSVMWFLISILPESLIDSIRLGMCIKIRKKGQAKDAKKKAQWCFRLVILVWDFTVSWACGTSTWLRCTTS